MKHFENKTIVVPFDFSDSAMEAVNESLNLAEDSTSIHVIHVVEPVPIIISVDLALPVPPSYDQGRYEQAVEQMQATFGKGKYARLKINCTIGNPGSEIVDYAETIRADMIVMSSHGHSGLKRLFLGSVADRVLRLATCPVLILRKPDSH